MVWVVCLRAIDVGKHGYRLREEPRRVADGGVPLAPSLSDRPSLSHKLPEKGDDPSGPELLFIVPGGCYRSEVLTAPLSSLGRFREVAPH